MKINLISKLLFLFILLVSNANAQSPSELAEELLRQEKAIRKLSKEKQDLIQKLNKKKDELTASRQSIKEYELKLKEVNSLTEQLNNYRATAEKYKEDLERMSLESGNAIAEKDIIISILKSDIENINTALAEKDKEIAKWISEVGSLNYDLIKSQNRINQLKRNVTELRQTRLRIKLTSSFGKVYNSKWNPTGKLLVEGNSFAPIVKFNGKDIPPFILPYNSPPDNFNEFWITQARRKVITPPDNIIRWREQGLFGGGGRELYSHQFIDVQYFFKKWWSVDFNLSFGKYWHTGIVTEEELQIPYDEGKSTHRYLFVNVVDNFVINYGFGSTFDILKIFNDSKHSLYLSIGTGHPYRYKTSLGGTLPLTNHLSLNMEASYFNWIDKDIYMKDYLGNEITVSERDLLDESRMQVWSNQHRIYVGLGLVFDVTFK